MMPADEFPGDNIASRDDIRAASLQAAELSSRGPARYLTRVAVKSVNRIVIVQVAEIVRLEAEDNYVRLWADRPYLHKETLTHLIELLDPAEFLRVHRSHAVNIQAVRELRPLLHGEFLIVLSNGTELTSGRSYRATIQHTFGLA
jgi:two-component system, LytTR family, response regulator